MVKPHLKFEHVLHDFKVNHFVLLQLSQQLEAIHPCDGLMAPERSPEGLAGFPSGSLNTGDWCVMTLMELMQAFGQNHNVTTTEFHENDIKQIWQTRCS